MAKKIIIKELSPDGHETYQMAIEKIPYYMETKIDKDHVAYCEPMHKIVDSVNELEYLLDRITEIIIIPKIKGG